MEYKKEYRFQLNEAKQQMEENNTNANFVIPAVISEPLTRVPSIYAWVEAKLDHNQKLYDSDYYCFFETSRKLCRLYEVFNKDESQIMSRLHPLLSKPIHDNEAMDVAMDINMEEHPLFTRCTYIPETCAFFSTEQYYMTHSSLNLFERIVFCLKEEYMGRDSIKKLPLGISLPIQEVLNHDYFKTIYTKSSEAEKRAIEEWPKEVFKLIEREDLYYNFQEMKKLKDVSEEATPEFQFSRISTLNMNKQLSKRRSTLKLGRTESNIFANVKKSIVNHKAAAKSQPKQTATNTEENETQEYFDLIEKEFKSLGLKNNNIDENHFINYRFSSDLRYMEVCVMLDSSIPFKLRMDKIEDIGQMTPEQYDTAKIIMHESCIVRHFAKGVGRGALKLGTIHTVPTEKLKIPEICKTGLLAPEYKKIELREDHVPIPQNWADFHNGVSAGLQLATEFDPYSNHIKNWILYHKPPTPKDEFGGFLMAMGFHGYLK